MFKPIFYSTSLQYDMLKLPLLYLTVPCEWITEMRESIAATWNTLALVWALLLPVEAGAALLWTHKAKTLSSGTVDRAEPGLGSFKVQVLSTDFFSSFSN